MPVQETRDDAELKILGKDGSDVRIGYINVNSDPSNLTAIIIILLIVEVILFVLSQKFDPFYMRKTQT